MPHINSWMCHNNLLINHVARAERPFCAHSLVTSVTFVTSRRRPLLFAQGWLSRLSGVLTSVFPLVLTTWPLNPVASYAVTRRILVPRVYSLSFAHGGYVRLNWEENTKTWRCYRNKFTKVMLSDGTQKEINVIHSTIPTISQLKWK